MNRRGFLKFAAAAPVAAPTIAATAVAPSFASVRGLPVTFGSFMVSGDWVTLSHGHYRWGYSSRDATLAAQVNRSVEQMTAVADEVGNLGARSEFAISRLLDVAEKAVDTITKAVDPVEQQMTEHDLFEEQPAQLSDHQSGGVPNRSG